MLKMRVKMMKLCEQMLRTTKFSLFELKRGGFDKGWKKLKTWVWGVTQEAEKGVVRVTHIRIPLTCKCLTMG